MTDEMNKIEIPKCSFSEYYGSAASISKMAHYLDVLRSEGEFPFQKTGRKRSDFDYARNMKQLGLIDMKDSSYFLTPRGQSILIVDQVVDSKHPWKNQLIKFCILKSLADFDWQCITSLLWYSQVLKEEPNRLRKLFCPFFSERNFKDHWLRLHLRLAKETDLLVNYMKRYYLGEGKNVKTTHERASHEVHPYFKDFIGNSFFGVKHKLLEDASRSLVQNFLPESLKIYSQFSGNEEIGNIEPVKFLLLANALKGNKFISEPVLSKVMLEIFLEKEIPLYRVLSDMQFSGRGVFHWIGATLEYYPDFNLYIALRKFI